MKRKKRNQRKTAKRRLQKEQENVLSCFDVEFHKSVRCTMRKCFNKYVCFTSCNFNVRFIYKYMGVTCVTYLY